MEHSFDIYSEIKASIHFEELEAYYKNIQRNMAICKHAQMIDTYSHTKSRVEGIIQSQLLQRGPKPFVFIICLN